MNALKLGIVLALLPIVGCTSVGPIAEALDKPVARAKSAADVALAAEKDVLRAHALGNSGAMVTDLQDVMCVPSLGPSVVGSGLMVFVDSLETIKKVGEAPSDTSYAGYIAKFKENSAASAMDPKAERDEAIRINNERRARCRELAAADLQYGQIDAPKPTSAHAAFMTGLAQFLALDGLFKSVLGKVEAAQRMKAVKDTLKHLAPQMREAADALKSPPNEAFGPRIQYRPGAGEAASKMNATTLGATVTIRRWSVAQQARANWASLAACRLAGSTCAQDPGRQRASEELAASIYQYRALAAIDTDKMLASLSQGIADAETAAKADSPANLLDSIIDIAGAISDVNGSYEAFRKTRE